MKSRILTIAAAAAIATLGACSKGGESGGENTQTVAQDTTVTQQVTQDTTVTQVTTTTDTTMQNVGSGTTATDTVQGGGAAATMPPPATDTAAQP